MTDHDYQMLQESLKFNIHLNDKISNMKYKCQIHKSGILNVLDNIIKCFIVLMFSVDFRPIFQVFLVPLPPK